MKSLLDLFEVTYSMYETYVMVEFSDETNITDIAQVLRSMPMVTVVNNKTDKEDKNPRGVLLIKILTLKPGVEAFTELKKVSLSKIPDLKTFKFSEKRLQKIDEI
jgi:hypothetical protein